MEIFTSTTRYCGSLTLPGLVRVSDYLNETSNAYLSLSGVATAILHDGLGRESAPMSELAIKKSNILVTVVRWDSLTHRMPELRRVPKTAQRIRIFAPPFSLEGLVHFVPGVRLLDGLNGAERAFLPLTKATLWWTETYVRLGHQVDFAVVNQQWITALHPLPLSSRKDAVDVVCRTPSTVPVGPK